MCFSTLPELEGAELIHCFYTFCAFTISKLNCRGKCISSCTTITCICYLFHTHTVWTKARIRLINALRAGPRSLSVSIKVKAQTFRHFRKKLAYNLLISNVASIVRAILFPLVCLLVNEHRAQSCVASSVKIKVQVSA